MCAQHLIGDEPFAVLLADDLMRGPAGGQPVLAQMADQAMALNSSVIAVQEVPPEEVSRYGIIAGEPLNDRLTRVRRLVEKPPLSEAPSRMAVAGRYILSPAVLGYIRRQKHGALGEIQLTDAIAAMMADEPVHAWRYEGKRYDCGSKQGCLRATVELGLQHPDVGADFREYLKTLQLD